MRAKWKKSDRLDPQVILNKIESLATRHPDNSVSFSSFEFDSYITALASMLELPNKYHHIDRDDIVLNSIFESAKSGTLNKKSMILEVQNQIVRYTKQKEQKYFIVTTLSVDRNFPFKKYRSTQSNTRIFHGPLFKKYSSRNSISTRPFFDKDRTPKNYANVIISTKAKSHTEAIEISLDSIDLNRSLWSLFSNSYHGVITPEQWVPINKIRLGMLHTIHRANGTIAKNTFWYDPNFKPAMPYRTKNPAILKSNTNWARKNLYKSKYIDTLNHSLLQYVRALDENDQSVAFLKLWTALETIAVPEEVKNYKKLIERCSSLYINKELHIQILEHLRECRNLSVHSGHKSTKFRTICYQLQSFYYNLILYHIRNSHYFHDIYEANEFLELPNSTSTLNRKKQLIEKAIKFRSQSST